MPYSGASDPLDRQAPALAPAGVVLAPVGYLASLQRHRVTDWPASNAGLREHYKRYRTSLTFAAAHRLTRRQQSLVPVSKTTVFDTAWAAIASSLWAGRCQHLLSL